MYYKNTAKLGITYQKQAGASFALASISESRFVVFYIVFFCCSFIIKPNCRQLTINLSNLFLFSIPTCPINCQAKIFYYFYIYSFFQI